MRATERKRTQVTFRSEKAIISVHVCVGMIASLSALMCVFVSVQH